MFKSFVHGLKPNRILRDEEARNRVVGWAMNPGDVLLFFKSLGKTVITLFGYSTVYEHQDEMLAIAKKALSAYSPKTHLVNIGATSGGIGAVYPLAKGMGFTTKGIVSSIAISYGDEISKDVDHICFVADNSWGGKLPDSGLLSPTSQAILICSDLLIGIGGGEISRDEMLAGRAMGKPLEFHPAEVNHQWLIHQAQKKNQPMPTSFLGAAHIGLMDDSKK